MTADLMAKFQEKEVNDHPVHMRETRGHCDDIPNVTEFSSPELSLQIGSSLNLLRCSENTYPYVGRRFLSMINMML